MNTVDITKDLPDSLATKWASMDFELSITELHDDLSGFLSQEELTSLESEYIASELKQTDPQSVIPGEFLEKINAIVAINTDTFSYTTDPFAFMNLVAVCNDLPAPHYKVQLFAPHQISRTLSAVNEITPKSMDFNSLEFSDSVLDYIFECYRFNSFYFLDRRLSRHQELFLSETSFRKAKRKVFMDIYAYTPDLDAIILKVKVSELKASLKEDKKNTKKVLKQIEEVLTEIDLQELSELLKANLIRYVIYGTYDKFYDYL